MIPIPSWPRLLQACTTLTVLVGGSHSSPVPQGPISIPSAVIFPQGRLPRRGRQQSNIPAGGLRLNDPNLGNSAGSESAVATGLTALNLAQSIGITGGQGQVQTGRLNEGQFQGGVRGAFQGGFQNGGSNQGAALPGTRTSLPGFAETLLPGTTNQQVRFPQVIRVLL